MTRSLAWKPPTLLELSRVSPSCSPGSPGDASCGGRVTGTRQAPAVLECRQPVLRACVALPQLLFRFVTTLFRQSHCLCGSPSFPSILDSTLSQLLSHLQPAHSVLPCLTTRQQCIHVLPRHGYNPMLYNSTSTLTNLQFAPHVTNPKAPVHSMLRFTTCCLPAVLPRRHPLAEGNWMGGGSSA